MTNQKMGELPSHIAIIMDGNGRWAKAQGLPRTAGHKKGSDVLKNIVRYAGEIGIKTLSVYAFSTENWNRPKVEVAALFAILLNFCDNQVAELISTGTRLKFLGDIDGMPSAQRKAMRMAEQRTKAGNGLQFNVCINYGGRQEIVNAVKKMMADGLTPDDVSSERLADYLYTADIADPDLIIRTSGEKRLSNFFSWQSAYSEFVFINSHWPDFTPETLDQCIAEYRGRQRRFGKI